MIVPLLIRIRTRKMDTSVSIGGDGLTTQESWSISVVGSKKFRCDSDSKGGSEYYSKSRSRTYKHKRASYD